MADEKISQLTATTTFADADLMTSVQGGVNKQISGGSIKTDIGWRRTGTDVTPNVPGDDINIGTGGLKDNDVITPISLGDNSNTSFDTTNKTIVGALNEVNSAIIGSNEFSELTDVSAPYNNVGALTAVNATTDGMQESTTLLSEPAANQFQIDRGTASLLVKNTNIEVPAISLGTVVSNAEIQLGNTIVRKKITMFEVTNNQHQFWGFGLQLGTNVYQVGAPSSDHVFYAGTSTTTSAELLRVCGLGRLGINAVGAPMSTVDINGNLVVGNALAGVTAAPSNGLRVQGTSIFDSDVTLSVNIDLNLSGTGEVFVPASPTTVNSLTNKAYVDSLSNGLSWKEPARVASTGNLTLSGEQTIDTIAVVTGDRVLAKDQSDPTENGTYIADSSGWTRSTDMDAGSEFPGAALFINEGAVNGGFSFVCTNDVAPTLGVTNIDFVCFSGVINHNNTLGLQGGTTNEYYHLTSSEHTLATQNSSGSLTGLLSSTDWTTFNNKQAALTNGVDALTSAEVTQLSTIDTVTISNTQWGYLGSANQGIATTDSPTFVGTTLSGLSDGLVRSSTGLLSGAGTVDLASEVTGTLPIASVSLLSGITSLSTGTGDNDKLVTQGYVDDNAGGSSTFLALTDTPGSYTTANAIYNVNAGSTAVNETTTLLTQPAANRFAFSRGTASLDVSGSSTITGSLTVAGTVDFQGDATINITKSLTVTENCTLDQNVATTASPTHVGLTLSGLSDGLVSSSSGVLSGGNTVDLTSDVTGVLPVANGGAGAVDGEVAATGAASYGNSTVETSLIPTHEGTVTITGGTLTSGATFRVKMSSTIAALTTDSLTIRIKYGSTTLITNVVDFPVTAPVNQFFTFEGMIQFRTIAADSANAVLGTSTMIYTLPETVGNQQYRATEMSRDSTSTVSTSSNQDLIVTGQWSTASTLNNINVEVFTIEKIF